MNSSKQRTRCVIVGGGSAGWMTASYLSKALAGIADVTLIESPNVGTVGVGEATFSTFKLFFDALGLDESDWMPECSASYKLAIRFVNWTPGEGHFYHPFERLPTLHGVSAAEWWLKLRRPQDRFDYSCFVVPTLCDAMRSPRFLNGEVYDDQVRPFFPTARDGGAQESPNVLLAHHRVQYPYGYHLNAAELAGYLRGYAVQRGVTHVIDDVVEVPLNENGGIAAIRTKQHGLVEGDLFIDCTGFRGILINGALKEPFVPFAASLLNDSAVAIQVPRDIQRDGLRPYTTAHAHNAGWSWNIPLYGRDGTGYVYSSSFIDAAEAEREFREFLGPAADGCKANHIKMRIGRNGRSWVKNCVAIGLSSGFVEPLESTGLFFIQHAIEELVSHFPAGQIDENLVTSYNKLINDCIDGVRDFLTLHYIASQRNDTPFWRAARDARPSDTLRERLRIWKARLPNPRNVYPGFHGFESDSWATMLLGLGNHAMAYPRTMDTLDSARGRIFLGDIRRRGSDLVSALPSAYEYLTHMREAAAKKVPLHSYVSQIRPPGGDTGSTARVN